MLFGEYPVSELTPGAILAHSCQAGARQLKKGRILSREDLKLLSETGVTSVMAAILDEGDIHEDAAADRIAGRLAGPGLTATESFTGRSNLIAGTHGLLVLEEDDLRALNRISEAVTVATLPAWETVLPNQMLATVKIIPFSVTGTVLDEWLKLADAGRPLMKVAPFSRKQVTLIQTDLAGFKQSLFAKTEKVLRQRLEALGSELAENVVCPHAVHDVAKQLQAAVAGGADLIIVSGASAITDRQDTLPAALMAAGGDVEHVGMPVDPGNLLMTGSLSGVPVVGMPGCARSVKLNGFDWVLRRHCADLAVNGDDIRDMGIGGLLKEIPSRPLPRAQSAPRGESGGRPAVVPLLLAAGKSSRMGPENKLLTDFRGKPLLCHAVENVKACGLANMIAVSGHEHAAVEAVLRSQDVPFIHNPDYASGMSSSLRRGIAQLPRECDAVLVCLGDMPFVAPSTMKQLIRAFDPVEGRQICLPVKDGRRGHPVLIGRRFFTEILEVTGDKGARDLIRAYPEAVCEVTVEDPGIFVDLDTPEAFDSHSR